MTNKNPSSDYGKVSYQLPPDKAAKVLNEGIQFLRSQIAGLEDNTMNNFMPVVVSTAIGATLAAAAFRNKFSKTVRVFSGIGAGISGLFAGDSILGMLGSVNFNNNLKEISNYLDRLEQDGLLKQQLLLRMAEHTPHGESPEGKIEYNSGVVGNMILNYGRDSGAMSPNNQLGTLEITAIKNGDARMLQLVQGLKR